MTKEIKEEPLLLTSFQAAKKLNVCQKTLWTYTKSGFIPCIRIGRNVRYSVELLKEFIDENLEYKTTKEDHNSESAVV